MSADVKSLPATQSEPASVDQMWADALSIVATMPPLSHNFDKEAGKPFDPSKSDVYSWLRDNLKSETLVSLAYFKLKQLGAIAWDSENRLWVGKFVEPYVPQERKPRAPKAEKPKKKKGDGHGRPSQHQPDYITDMIVDFHKANGHWPTTKQLQEFCHKKDGMPQSTFFRYLVKARKGNLIETIEQMEMHQGRNNRYQRMALTAEQQVAYSYPAKTPAPIINIPDDDNQPL